VSVNVGRPRDVPWRGRTVHTGVWKRSVPGPRMVRRLNIDGDGQGDTVGHGGPDRAVLVYQLASYEHWQRHFDRNDFEYGQFGENFTVDGLPDDEVCIGDRYAIGDALFEVSQPRVTCYRVGLRLDEPQMPALLVSHHRPGFYLRVLREGLVEAGDPVIKVHADTERMTVADIDALLYLPGHDRQLVVRALRIGSLSPGWKASFEALSATEDDAPGNPGQSQVVDSTPRAWEGFRPVRVARILPETDAVVSLELTSIDGSPLPAPAPGQSVAFRLDLDDGQPPIPRSYSLSGAPDEPHYRVSVKREPHGRGSGFIHDRVRVGQVLEMSAPRGRFTLDRSDAPLLLVSAGIGATPVLAMLHDLAAAGSARDVWWVHSARNRCEHAFANEVADLLDHLAASRRLICYSSPAPTDVLGTDYTHRGRITADLIMGIGPPADAQAYVCGPRSFMDEIRDALEVAGLDSQRIHVELFGATAVVTPGIATATTTAPHQPTGDAGLGPTISFARSGLSVAWRHDFGSLLELAEACDVPTRWSCRSGVCRSCESGLLAGDVAYDPDPVDPAVPGSVLLCCAVPCSDITLDL